MIEQATPEAIESPEELQTPDIIEDDASDDWGISALQELVAKEAAEEAPEEAPEAEEEAVEHEADEEYEEEIEAEEEPEELEEKPKPRKNSVSDRINKINEKHAAEMKALEDKLDNLMAAQEYLKPDTPKATLDERLEQAAKQYGDAEFDLDEFSTDAEKKTALLTYHNGIANKQQKYNSTIGNVKQQYISAVNHYKASDPEVGARVEAAYNAAVQSEGYAINRRHPQLTQAQAMQHAEKSLLEEAANTADPVMHIAKYGHSLLPTQAPLQKKKKAATINHKNRDEVRKRAGKPNIDPMPTSKRALAISEDFKNLDF